MQKAAVFPADEALRLGEGVGFASDGVRAQSGFVRLVRCQGGQRVDAEAFRGGSLMGREITDEIGAAGGNGLAPHCGVAHKRIAAPWVHVVFDETGDGVRHKCLRVLVPIEYATCRSQWFGYGRTMLDGPDIARIAALIGDPARANMLCALMDGRALTATELAGHAGVSKQTASTHLARLSEAGLLANDRQGRHRYFRLLDPDVARALEALMGVAERGGGRRVRTGPREPAMRRARICYDHLAGDIAVRLLDELVTRGWLEVQLAPADVAELGLTEEGRIGFNALGLDMETVERARRPACRACLDWSARRHHLAGGLGAALFDFAVSEVWIRRRPDSRLISVTKAGEQALKDVFGVDTS